MVKSLLDYNTGDQVRVFTKKETELFIKMAMLPEDVLPDFEKHVAADFTAQVMIKRLEYAGVQYDVRLVALTGVLSGSVAEAVMWAHAICRMAKEQGGEASWNDFAMKYFPVGVPTAESLHECWQQQKVEGDNYLDRREAWT